MLIADRAALLALSAVSLVSAQANSNSTFKIDPSEVDPIDRSTSNNAVCRPFRVSDKHHGDMTSGDADCICSELVHYRERKLLYPV